MEFEVSGEAELCARAPDMNERNDAPANSARVKFAPCDTLHPELFPVLTHKGCEKYEQ